MLGMKRRSLAGSLAILIVMGAMSGCEADSTKVEVPGVVGSSVDEAVDAINARGLEAVVRGDPGQGANWLVVQQDPNALGDPVEAGSEVALTVESILEAAAEDCAIPGGAADRGASLILDFAGSDAGSGELIDRHYECIVRELEVPDAVQATIMSTRALDGRQTADWNGITATWTYHPDEGLELILEIDD